MSTPFYDLASLVVVPSGYKSGKIYAQKPLTTDGQLTFTRASTATRVNASGLIESVASGVPRLDYQGSTCPKLLLEPQRTNYARNNTTFAAWQATAAGDSYATAAGISPDGTNNAVKLLPNTLNAGHQFYDGLTNQASGGNFVMSCYAKAAGLTKFALRESQSIGYYATFNLSNGTIVEAGPSVTASIQSMGNGWYRCTAVVTGSNLVCIGLVPLPSGYTSGDPIGYAYAGNGTDGVLVYQPQLEVSSTYVTSPISTNGVASATRLADSVSKTGVSSLIGQTEGTLYADVDLTLNGDATGILAIFGSGITFVYLFTSNSTNVLNANVYVNGTGEATMSYTLPAAGRYKIAVGYKANDFVLYVNGVQRGSDNSGAVPACSDLYIDSTTYNIFPNSKHREALIFKTRLTNAQLAELTTL